MTGLGIEQHIKGDPQRAMQLCDRAVSIGQ
jgi:hypothetical protein